MSQSRRTFLKVLGAGAAAAFSSGPIARALADSSNSKEFFILIHQAGGWDVTLWADPRNSRKGGYIGDPATTLEIAWASARSASVSLLVNGTASGTLSGIDTSAYTLEEVRLGPSGGLSSSMSGTEYFDHFVSDRTTPLGL